MTTLIIAIILTLGYNLVACVKNRGILPSLSDSFYVFGGKDKRGYVFYLYLAAMAFLLIVPMMDVTPEKWQFPAFFGVVLLAFVGVAADFAPEGMERTVHLACALASAVLCLAWCSIIGCWDVALRSMGAATVIAYINPEGKTYWLEMGCFAAVFVTLMKLLT